MSLIKIILICIVIYCIINIINIIINSSINNRYVKSRHNIYKFALYLYYNSKLDPNYINLHDYTYKGQISFIKIDPTNLENTKIDPIIRFIQFVDDDNYSLYTFYNEKNLDNINSKDDIENVDFFAVYNMNGIATINVCGMNDFNIKDDPAAFKIYRKSIIKLDKTISKMYKHEYSVIINQL